ncbi:kinesin motor domain-containing protein [Diplogelasinospora grovesii]|uniref:Kinesin-like protein KIP2 n=1 Tax=Diplogelasinospora grovesii TaxID=303347 RepID=A0AAN6S7U7_9PEZI|nr:kinesin motor domain-containing protein [Diplogelasinospora grovesii]
MSVEKGTPAPPGRLVSTRQQESLVHPRMDWWSRTVEVELGSDAHRRDILDQRRSVVSSVRCTFRTRQVLIGARRFTPDPQSNEKSSLPLRASRACPVRTTQHTNALAACGRIAHSRFGFKGGPYTISRVHFVLGDDLPPDLSHGPNQLAFASELKEPINPKIEADAPIVNDWPSLIRSWRDEGRKLPSDKREGAARPRIIGDTLPFVSTAPLRPIQAPSGLSTHGNTQDRGTYHHQGFPEARGQAHSPNKYPSNCQLRITTFQDPGPIEVHLSNHTLFQAPFDDGTRAEKLAGCDCITPSCLERHVQICWLALADIWQFGSRITMSNALPRPSRPSNGPPTVALPALPVGKTRKSTGAMAIPSGKLTPTTPKTGLRAPSSTFLPSTSPVPSSTVPHPRSVSGINNAGRTLRKAVSINSFPQPPRGEGRVTSLPPSPLSTGVSSRKSKTPTTPNYLFSSGTPSLLNGTGEGKSVARNSDGLISVSSPPQSRSSSAQDSYSTSATQYEDLVDLAQQKLDASAANSSKRQSKTDGKGNVIVSVRVRPDAGGNDAKPDGEWMVDGRKSLIAYNGKEGGDYYYGKNLFAEFRRRRDNVFTTHDDNSRVYDHIAKRLVRRVMEGYHGTVFAYGMTGTGKTFSMQGTASSPGVIPLAITDIFSYIRETPSREFLLRVSYLEIYNEKIHDLLSMPTGNGIGANQAQEEIKLREDAKRGVYASPLKEEIVQSPTQLLRVIARGDQARRTASTQFNARSSRSHAVVQIVVESRERIPGNPAGDNKRQGLPPGGVRVSTLSLIDLAGSEKAAESKERRQEGSHINKSLLTLGTVIAKLCETKDKDGKSADKDGKHLPYRDSKLTRLLQGALSGNSLVSILCTIQIGAAGSAASSNTHTSETINTLKFASRAKNNIVSHAKRAEEALGSGGDGGARVLLERYRMEIQDLKKELEAQAKKNSNKEDEEEKERDALVEREREKEAEYRHEEQMLEMQLARTALKERIDHLNRLILSSKSIGVNASGSYSSLGNHPRYSQGSLSVRSSMAASTTGRPMMERTASMTSTSSTIGRRSSGHRSSGGVEAPPPAVDDDDSMGEFGDGTASLTAQNRALQADLADKNRYIQTLEKRLLQARRASSSRTSVGLASGKGIMVGEDHSVSALIKEKDAEIVELRARLDDKDKMLAALRTAARSRENADRVESRAEVRASQIIDPQHASPPSAAGSPTISSPTMSLARQVSTLRKRTKSVDEMSKMLDEMIQDRVESGQIIRGNRGSVRVAPDRERKEPPNEPPIQLQLLSKQRASFMSEPPQIPLPNPTALEV